MPKQSNYVRLAILAAILNGDVYSKANYMLMPLVQDGLIDIIQDDKGKIKSATVTPGGRSYFHFYNKEGKF